MKTDLQSHRARSADLEQVTSIDARQRNVVNELAVTW